MDIFDLSDISKALIVKERLLSDFKFYCMYMYKAVYGRDFIWSDDIHGVIAYELMCVFRGRTTRLMIEAPPQTGKSLMCVPLFVSFCYAHNPMGAFINLSRSDDLIKKNSRQTKNIIESVVYRHLFGYSMISGADTVKEWQLAEGGEYNTASAGGQVAGKPAGRLTREPGFHGCVIADDLVKPDLAMYYKSERDLAFNALVGVQSRMATDQTAIILIMQRTDQDDPIGRVKKGLVPGDWRCVTIDAEDKNGESIWPHKWSTPYLKSLHQINPRFYNAQFRQRPMNFDDAIFKETSWQFYDILPPLEYIYIFCDTAQKKGEDNDYSMFAAWGYSDRKIYLVDIVHKRLTAPELKRALWAFVDKHHLTHGRVGVRMVFVEDAVSGTGLIQYIKEEGGIPIKGITRLKDKISRAHGAHGYIDSGYVFLPKRVQWLQDFIDEHTAFPNGPHDDQVDTTCDAIDNMLIIHRSKFFVGVT